MVDITLMTDEEEEEFWKEQLKKSREFWKRMDVTLDGVDESLKKILGRAKDDGTEDNR